MEKIENHDEYEEIIRERTKYRERSDIKSGKRVFEIFSLVAQVFAFLSLILIPFTSITLVQATCLFVISYTTRLTDLDYSDDMLRGMAEDLAHIRANISIMRKRDEDNKS